MLKRVALGIVASGLLMATPVASFADSHEEAEAATTNEVRCIDTRRIRSTKAVDNQTVIFRMRGGPDYKMTTVNRCSGLKMQGTIVYAPTPSNRLCSIDTIKVPITTSGGLRNAMFTHCPIDKFVVLEEETKGDS